MLKTYQSCPKKFCFQYIERVNVPRLSTPFEKGKKIHALAHYYLQGIDISKIENTLTQNERKNWKLLQANPYFQKKCYKSEFQLSCKQGNFWIGGRIDAIMQDDEKYYILDYKTGSTPQNPQYDFQTQVYLLALDKHLHGQKPIEFIYINLKTETDTVISFNSEIKPVYEKQIKKICTEINDDKIYKPNCASCMKCEYNTICSKTL